MLQLQGAPWSGRRRAFSYWELDVPDGISYFLQNTYLTLTLTSRVLFSVIRITDTSINVDGGGWSRYEML